MGDHIGVLVEEPSRESEGGRATDVVLQYLVDEVFDGSDEFGVAWDDPGIGVAWPSRNPTVSARDASNPPLTGIERPSYGASIS